MKLTETINRIRGLVGLNESTDQPIEVKVFKRGEGGTLGIFEDANGQLYKSISTTQWVQTDDGKWTREASGYKTEEYQILSKLQGNPHIPKIGRLVNTTMGEAFEIERLDEITHLTFDEYWEARQIISDLNAKGFWVDDIVTLMKRPGSGELVVVDFSTGKHDESMIDKSFYNDLHSMGRLKNLMSPEDKDKATTREKALSTASYKVFFKTGELGKELMGNLYLNGNKEYYVDDVVGDEISLVTMVNDAEKIETLSVGDFQQAIQSGKLKLLSNETN